MGDGAGVGGAEVTGGANGNALDPQAGATDGVTEGREGDETDGNEFARVPLRGELA